MSVADWYIDSGQFGLDMLEHEDRRSSYNPSEVPNPEDDREWSALCRDPQWKYVEKKEELFYCEVLENDDRKDYWGKKAKLRAVPVPAGMHRGALAPRRVFEATPSSEEEDNMVTYRQRLMCAVTGRFVCIERVDAGKSESLMKTQGKPTESVR